MATKVIKGLEYLSDGEWSKILGLSSLEKGLLRGDMIEVYKLMQGLER